MQCSSISISTREYALATPAFFYKSKNRGGSIASSAKPANGRHSWIVPAVYGACLHKMAQITLAHNGIRNVKTGEFVLMRLILKVYIVYYPVVERSVIFKFKRAQRMSNAFYGILNGWA